MKKLLYSSVLICMLSLSVFSEGILVGGGFAGCVHEIPACHVCDTATAPDPACDQGGGGAASIQEPSDSGGVLVDEFLFQDHWFYSFLK